MKKKQLEQMVLESKVDKQKMNDLIEAYKPFIVSCAQKLSGKYLTYGSDDELSVAMMAFMQAVYGYRTENGEFLSYASTVIRNSVIDYYRKQKSQTGKFVYIINNEDSDTEDLLETEVSLAAYDEEKLRNERLSEIQQLKDTLAKYDINFFELEKVCPKNKNTKKICKEVISYIKSNPDLINQTLVNKSLPLAEIEEGLGIKRKKFERHRKYILAVLIILAGDYPCLEEYVK
ncbi:MAG TPA: RNA polymerase sigma-I factor [Thermoclostridium sp.]